MITMRLCHGSEKHIVGNKFCLAKALMSDGNAAYGVGLYFARTADVAEMYSGRHGYIYYVDFTPKRLVNDLTTIERKLIAESVFDMLPNAAQVSLTFDWSDDGQCTRQAKRVIVGAVMREKKPEEWLSALQFSLSPQAPHIVNKLLSECHGVDGLVADMGDNTDCVVVINDQALTIEHVEMAREHRMRRREQRKEALKDHELG